MAEKPISAKVKLQITAGPVSYTHLRAHETVLDLVCRLLLEKKKTRPHAKAILRVIQNPPTRDHAEQTDICPLICTYPYYEYR